MLKDFVPAGWLLFWPLQLFQIIHSNDVWLKLYECLPQRSELCAPAASSPLDISQVYTLPSTQCQQCATQPVPLSLGTCK